MATVSSPLYSLEEPFDDFCHALRLNRASGARLLIRFALEQIGAVDPGPPYTAKEVSREVQAILRNPATRKTPELVKYAEARKPLSNQAATAGPSRRKF